ncbi:PaaI family thioesterase [Streptomyces vietnamensis]|uniref:Phenylacetic acid degradation protein PaaI n=1 Tax=Streptomyces vietnamensis TaxID=362257 RepID=A0A0B5IPD1_9ACTN|nr:hypothetical protein [Streptomyces vietnamensis]AJF70274.1 hypothetical protein SVTN_38485 [Streptomyces vietnamensis]
MEDPTHQEQASPEVRRRVQASFDRQGLMTHLGARTAHIGPGRVHIVLPARPEVTQQHGYFHAGGTSAVADSGERKLVAAGQQTLIRVNGAEQ